MKRERMEEGFLYYGLEAIITRIRETYEKNYKIDTSEKAPHRKTPLKDSRSAAYDVIVLEQLIRTIGKMFEIRQIDIDRLIEKTNKLKEYIDPALMKIMEAEEKEWLREHPERKNNMI